MGWKIPGGGWLLSFFRDGIYYFCCVDLYVERGAVQFFLHSLMMEGDGGNVLLTLLCYSLAGSINTARIALLTHHSL